jgi:hypothetical protein
MICISDAVYEKVMQALRAAGGKECEVAASELLTASAQSFIRDLQFAEAPALCRAQAG